MIQWTKNQISKVIRTGKHLNFVDNAEKVQEYYNNQMYAIEKDSPILKELLDEGILPVDSHLLTLQKGYYHIIDIKKKEPELKSQKRDIHIGYVLYRNSDSGDFWNKVYQVKLNPLINQVSEGLFNNDYTFSDLIGKTICVQKFELNEKSQSYHVNWFEWGDFEKSMNEYEIAEAQAEEDFYNNQTPDPILLLEEEFENNLRMNSAKENFFEELSEKGEEK